MLKDSFKGSQDHPVFIFLRFHWFPRNLKADGHSIGHLPIIGVSIVIPAGRF